jgi:hypothetical protein
LQPLVSIEPANTMCKGCFFFICRYIATGHSDVIMVCKKWLD